MQNRESSKAVRDRLGVRVVANESSWSDAHSTILFKWLEEIALQETYVKALLHV